MIPGFGVAGCVSNVGVTKGVVDMVAAVLGGDLVVDDWVFG